MESKKQAEITMRMSEFEVPPMQDVLIIGKKAPIGSEATRRMVDMLSPDQYEIVRQDHPFIEALVIRKSLFNLVAREKLVKVLLEESEKVSSESTVVRAQVSVTLQVSRSIEL